MLKKIAAMIIIVSTVLLLASCYATDGWADTPENALGNAANATLDDQRKLTPATVLDKFLVDGELFMLFVSEGDTLVQANMLINEDGQYHHVADTEEVSLENPDTMVLNGDKNQRILFSFFSDGAYVWGYKYSSVNITVNGMTPDTKSYKFECGGKEWSIDRWWVNIPNEDAEVVIDYVN